MAGMKNYSLTTSFSICFMVNVVALVAAMVFIRGAKGTFNPLLLVFVADVLATIVVFIFSVIFKNSSLYDPYWSVAPPFIAWYWLSPIIGRLPAFIIFLIMLFWAIRLTLNWTRGWKGMAHQDWRYTMLREKNPSTYFFTNLFGIHLFPTLLVFGGMLPVYYAAINGPANVCWWIFIAGALISVSATVIEFLADEQMRSFKKTAQPGAFINQGLWKYSRHPNYFGEITFWLGLWVMQMAIAPQYWWTMIGFVAILLLFVFASIPMMEEKNRKNKPGYEAYVKNVSALIPLHRRN